MLLKRAQKIHETSPTRQNQLKCQILFNEEGPLHCRTFLDGLWLCIRPKNDITSCRVGAFHTANWKYNETTNRCIKCNENVALNTSFFVNLATFYCKIYLYFIVWKQKVAKFTSKTCI